VDSRFRPVGKLVRRETQKLIVGYTFDLRTNTLKPESVDNPAAMRPPPEVIAEIAEAEENE